MSLTIQCNSCTRKFDIQETQRSEAKVRCPYCSALTTNVHKVLPIAKKTEQKDTVSTKSETKVERPLSVPLPSLPKPKSSNKEVPAPESGPATINLDEVLPELPEDLATLDMDALDLEPAWLETKSKAQVTATAPEAEDNATQPPTEAAQNNAAPIPSNHLLHAEPSDFSATKILNEARIDDYDDFEDDDDSLNFTEPPPAKQVPITQSSPILHENKTLIKSDNALIQESDAENEEFQAKPRSKAPIILCIILLLALISIGALASQNHGIFHFGKIPDMVRIATKSQDPMTIAPKMIAPPPAPAPIDQPEPQATYDVALSAPSRVTLTTGQSYIFVQASITPTSSRICEAPRFQLMLLNRLGMPDVQSAPTFALADSDQSSLASPEQSRNYVATLDKTQFDAWQQKLHTAGQNIVAKRGTKALSVLFFLDNIQEDALLGRDFLSVTALDCEKP